MKQELLVIGEVFVQQVQAAASAACPDGDVLTNLPRLSSQACRESLTASAKADGSTTLKTFRRFILQSTTNLVSSALWTTVTPGPVVAGGQNTVTNPISSTQQFYRLSQ